MWLHAAAGTRARHNDGEAADAVQNRLDMPRQPQRSQAKEILRQVSAWSVPAPPQDKGRPPASHAPGIKVWIRLHLRDAIAEQGRWLRAVARGFFAHHAVPTNSRALGAFPYPVTNLWHRALRHRNHKDGLTWERMAKLAAKRLHSSCVLHPWSNQRFAVKHPRVGVVCPNRARMDLCVGGCPAS